VHAMPFDAPRRPSGPAPLRRQGSIRRTSTIDADWPDGRDEPMRLQGHARDRITVLGAPAEPPGQTVEGRFDARVSLRREILELSTAPLKSEASALIGVRAGGHLRAALQQPMTADREHHRATCCWMIWPAPVSPRVGPGRSGSTAGAISYPTEPARVLRARTATWRETARDSVRDRPP
jgi:hypothetical protein